MKIILMKVIPMKIWRKEMLMSLFMALLMALLRCNSSDLSRALRTEENKTCSPAPLTSCLKALETLLLVCRLLVGSLLVTLWETSSW